MEHFCWDRELVERHKEAIFVDGSGFNDRLVDLIEFYHAFSGENDRFESLDCQQALARNLLLLCPEIQDFARMVLQKIKSQFRFCVVQNLGFEDFPEAIRDRFIVGFCSLISTPTVTDQRENKVIWPVRVVDDSTIQNRAASQHSGYVDPHTDSQYFAHPQSIVSLWCIQSDRNGEGQNQIIDAQRVIRNLMHQSGGAVYLQMLREQSFPFRVPSVFTQAGQDSDIECFSAPIVGVDPLIRYRRETLNKGLDAQKRALSFDEQAALDGFDQELKNPDNVFEVLLRRGDVLFMNNHEILHGRSPFRDRERHLLRVRMSGEPVI